MGSLCVGLLFYDYVGFGETDGSCIQRAQSRGRNMLGQGEQRESIEGASNLEWQGESSERTSRTK